MTLREAIAGACQDWWGPTPPGRVAVKSGTHGLADKVEHAVTLWLAEQDCLLDQIIALSRAGLCPMLRPSTEGFFDKKLGVAGKPGWNLQLRPEAGPFANQFIDFNGATLEDVLQEACDKYLPKEATT